MVSLGDVYSTGSFVLRDGPLVVSASTDGEFGGGESGVIIDSSNVASQEAALTFKNDAQSYIMGVDNDDVFRLNKATSLSGDNTSLGLAITSANFTYINGTIILLNGGYGDTGVNIGSTGIISTAGYVTIDQGLGVGTAGTSTAGLIRATNDVVAYYSSDKRLKDNLIKIGNPLDKISQLNGYEFDWIAKEGIHENEGHDVGVIAQEVEKVIPEIVQTRESGYKAVKYEKIVPLLIESIKELKQRVEELENGSN